MIILHIVPSYIPAYRYGGPIKSVHGLCKGLAELGHDVHVFTTNVDGPDDSDVPLGVPVDIDGVKVWYFPSKLLRRLYWSPLMAQALEQQVPNFDILHLHSIYLWPTWAAAHVARREQIPYLIAPRGMLVKDLVQRKSRLAKTAWLALIERRNIECAAGLHITSSREEVEARYFGFKLPPFYTVPNGFDEETDQVSSEVSPQIAELLKKPDMLLFLGRINWEKGLDRLIPAMQHVPAAHLILAGNDEENYRPALETLADKCNVRDRITFTGTVQGSDKAALLQHAAIVVLPSYSENFGNVVLEAMAVGCPVVVTPEVGAADIVREYCAGLVIDGDPATLGAGLQSLLEDPEEREQMGLRGRQAVEEHFSWGAVAQQMESVYTEILRDKSIL